MSSFSFDSMESSPGTKSKADSKCNSNFKDEYGQSKHRNSGGGRLDSTCPISMESITSEAIGTNSVDGNSSRSNNSNRSGKLMSSRSARKTTGDDFARKETKYLTFSKGLVFLVLCIAAVLSAYGVYRASASDDEEAYETRFNDFANEIIAVSKLNAEAVVQAYETMSLHITAASDVEAWPSVIVAGFEGLSRDMMDFTETRFVGLTQLVPIDERDEFEQFQLNNREWIEDAVKFSHEGDSATTIQAALDTVDSSITPYIFDRHDETNVPERAAKTATLRTGNINGNSNGEEMEYFLPLAQISPILQQAPSVNFNVLDRPYLAIEHERVKAIRATVLSNFTLSNEQEVTADRRTWPSSTMATPIWRTLKFSKDEQSVGDMVGMITGDMPWHGYFHDLIPEGIDGVYLVVRSTCGGVITFRIDGPEVTFLGNGDLHVSEDDLEVMSDFDRFGTLEACQYTLHLHPTKAFHSRYHTNQPIINTITVVLTFVLTTFVFILYDIMVESRQSKVMKIATRSSTIVNSLFPDNVRDRLMNEDGSDEGNSEQRRKSGASQALAAFGGTSAAADQVVGMQAGGDQIRSGPPFKAKPIADLFPQVTVLFADIVGFTAWASIREPSQVFELLETVYNSFDRMARRLGVFKVETIGDCYVAATGLPEQRADHAVVMARFAKGCLIKLQSVLHELCMTLGPGTKDLSIRIGLHSGPVTAGVLRGDKSRFQLFGDTVNTAARMEQTGKPGEIHISQETADALVTSGKTDWVIPRRDAIVAKGKGTLSTFWVQTPARNPITEDTWSSNSNSAHAQQHRRDEAVADSDGGDESGSYCHGATVDADSDSDGFARVGSVGEVREKNLEEHAGTGATETEKYDSIIEEAASQAPATKKPSSQRRRRSRLHTQVSLMELEIQWNVDALLTMLKRIVAMRPPADDQKDGRRSTHPGSSDGGTPRWQPTVAGTPFDELEEAIEFPSETSQYLRDPATIQLDGKVREQVEDFVRQIASMYRDNPFHNFSHASHVVQSTMKLLSRVVTKDTIDYKAMQYKKEQSDQMLHAFTYGITSDPITQFSCVLAALIHDIDHHGVPNSQLVKENTRVAQTYNNKSVAEQNSLDLAWDLLMDESYSDFRDCIYMDDHELNHFRQLMVNMVLATDIMDKELGSVRKARWIKSFDQRRSLHANINRRSLEIMGGLESLSSGVSQDEAAEAAMPPVDQIAVNRMATIVIEHLIQASDVAHTMQHWHIYLKWNERLFHEMYRAYQEGRSETDPLLGWYQGELSFFDFYIIPLAKKLRECGVFGVSSDEYLNYALANRREWESRGEETVQTYLGKYRGEIKR